MIDDVLEAMRRTASAVILPRFRALQAHEIEEKSPGEVVTIVDREAEAIIAEALRRIRPDAVVAHAAQLGKVMPGFHCAGAEHQAIVAGDQDFAMFKRTLPWDHAPGAFILREAGGIARRWDGSDYEPTIDGVGLIAAADDMTWRRVTSVMIPAP